MNTRQKILKLFGSDGYVPMRRMKLISTLKFKKDEAQHVYNQIDQMLESGEIARVKKDHYYIPKDVAFLSGRIIFRQNGSAVLIPDANPSSKGYPIKSEDTSVAMHGDTVLAKKIDRKRSRNNLMKRQYGRNDKREENPNLRVVQILRRKRINVSGTLKKRGHLTHVVPDDPRIIREIIIPDPQNSNTHPVPKHGDKVVVRLLEWKKRHLSPEGEIIKVLGRTHEPETELKAILFNYNLNQQFPVAVEKQIKGIPNNLRSKDIGNRKDCRQIFTFTIDPDDAKDFDDALSLEVLANGNVRVGVHIADVSAYIKPNSALDREAKKRGNSTYLVGAVIPMLPQVLSNGLCSLVEAEDRLTKTCFITFNKSADVLNAEFSNTVICSNKRLTYKQAHAFLTLKDIESIRKTPLPPEHQTGSIGRTLEEISEKDMSILKTHIEKLWLIASKLRARRFQNGSLDLSMTEIKIYVDENGYADHIERQYNDESHQLVEEFMLCANEQIARVIRKTNIPSIYRVHEKPDKDKLKELRETMHAFGIQCGNLDKPREMTNLLKKLKEHPQGYTLKVQILRSFNQAQYRASADGHYGLSKPDYTHFTSPIRRYSDLIVHRVLDGYLHKIGSDSCLPDPDISYTQRALESICDHVSITERNSIDAERESVKLKLLEFYEKELRKEKKQHFKAIITDIKNNGLFVELTDTLAYGMVNISTLEDDFYHISSEGTALTGQRWQRTYSLGEYILVQVDRVDRFKRQIDFRIVLKTNTDQKDKKCRSLKVRVDSQARNELENLAKKTQSIK